MIRIALLALSLAAQDPAATTPSTIAPATPQVPASTPPAAPVAGAPSASAPAARAPVDRADTANAQPAARDDGGWVELDRVVMIVNHDILPLGRMQRDLERSFAGGPNPTRSEIQRRQTEIQSLHVRNSLASQAGQDLGADEKLVDRLVNDRIQREIEGRNGVVGLAAYLESRGMTTEDMRRRFREELYADAWEETVTGRGSGVAARPSQDRWVRPGLRRFHYENAITHDEALGALGGRSETWKLQLLPLPCAMFGGEEATTKLALEIKAQIEGGADMSELVQRYLPTDKERGLVEATARSFRARDKAIAAFASTAVEGAVSDPLPLETPQGKYVRLVRLIAREPAVVPAFGDAVCQNALVENVQRELDEYRLERAYAQLFQAAYVWPEEVKQTARRR